MKIFRMLTLVGALLSISAHARGPAPDVDLQAIVNKAHTQFQGLEDGANADYIPALDQVPSDLFGVVIVTADGKTYSAGDADYLFSIQSVAKPFTAALVMQQQGPDVLQSKIGVEPTGFPFNSKLALELLEPRSVNPMVNAGAIAAVSLVEADNEKDRWGKVLDNLNGFANDELELMNDVFDSEYSTSWSNRAIANLLFNYERLYSEPEEALVVYTKQSSVGINTKQLAMMGATLANGGINPISGRKMLESEHVPELLAVMLAAGFYDESGLWSFRAGMPAKTGVGGGIVAISPGRLAVAAFSPRLNEAGNSIRASRAIEYISTALELNIFSAPTK